MPGVRLCAHTDGNYQTLTKILGILADVIRAIKYFLWSVLHHPTIPGTYTGDTVDLDSVDEAGGVDHPLVGNSPAVLDRHAPDPG